MKDLFPLGLHWTANAGDVFATLSVMIWPVWHWRPSVDVKTDGAFFTWGPLSVELFVCSEPES